MSSFVDISGVKPIVLSNSLPSCAPTALAVDEKVSRKRTLDVNGNDSSPATLRRTNACSNDPSCNDGPRSQPSVYPAAADDRLNGFSDQYGVGAKESINDIECLNSYSDTLDEVIELEPLSRVSDDTTTILPKKTEIGSLICSNINTEKAIDDEYQLNVNDFSSSPENEVVYPQELNHSPSTLSLFLCTPFDGEAMRNLNKVIAGKEWDSTSSPLEFPILRQKEFLRLLKSKIDQKKKNLAESGESFRASEAMNKTVSIFLLEEYLSAPQNHFDSYCHSRSKNPPYLDYTMATSVTAAFNSKYYGERFRQNIDSVSYQHHESNVHSRRCDNINNNEELAKITGEIIDVALDQAVDSSQIEENNDPYDTNCEDQIDDQPQTNDVFSTTSEIEAVYPHSLNSARNNCPALDCLNPCIEGYEYHSAPTKLNFPIIRQKEFLRSLINNLQENEKISNQREKNLDSNANINKEISQFLYKESMYLKKEKILYPQNHSNRQSSLPVRNSATPQYQPTPQLQYPSSQYFSNPNQSFIQSNNQDSYQPHYNSYQFKPMWNTHAFPSSVAATGNNRYVNPPIMPHYNPAPNMYPHYSTHSPSSTVGCHPHLRYSKKQPSHIHQGSWKHSMNSTTQFTNSVVPIPFQRSAPFTQFRVPNHPMTLPPSPKMTEEHHDGKSQPISTVVDDASSSKGLPAMTTTLEMKESPKVAMASKPMTLSDLPMDQWARLPIAFGFLLDDDGTSQETALSCQRRWVTSGKTSLKKLHPKSQKGSRHTDTNLDTTSSECNKETNRNLHGSAALLVSSGTIPNLPKGWTVKTYERQGGQWKGNLDSYYFSPEKGFKFRSMKNVMIFQNILSESTVNGNEEMAYSLYKSRGHKL